MLEKLINNNSMTPLLSQFVRMKNAVYHGFILCSFIPLLFYMNGISIIYGSKIKFTLFLGMGVLWIICALMAFTYGSFNKTNEEGVDRKLFLFELLFMMIGFAFTHYAFIFPQTNYGNDLAFIFPIAIVWIFKTVVFHLPDIWGFLHKKANNDDASE
jgi:hypothetical protein